LHPHIVPLLYPAPPPTELYTLSLHDALPICAVARPRRRRRSGAPAGYRRASPVARRQRSARNRRRADRDREAAIETPTAAPRREDRKSTRLNSSHVKISYAVFCLKKKKSTHQ